MTMEQRVAAAVAALDKVAIDDTWNGNDDTAYCVILAAFPELFDGTAWLAPVHITPMVEAIIAGSLDYPSVYMGGPSQQSRKNARRLWEAVIYDVRNPTPLPSPPEASPAEPE